MDNTKHTPGPWCGIEGHVYADRPDFMVAKVFGRSKHQDDTSELEANTRLIAAAPEMYEALKAFKATFPTTLAGLRDFSVVDLQDALKLANQAISRVEGEL